jgi:hypothetical protein
VLLTLGLGLPAQAKPSAAGTVSLRQGGVLEEITAFGVALFLTLKSGGGLCGTGYCPTPPPPPPPFHDMSIAAFKPHSLGKGSRP